MTKMNREPLWRADTELPSFPILQEQIFADVVIVGGGITGIVTGYMLTKEGKKVAILEADELLNGTTGHTTAKVTAQHNLIYDQLITSVGEEQARLYYEANAEAARWIRETIQQEGIECGFQEETAYVYTNSEEKEPSLLKEAESYKKLGIEGSLVDSMPWKTPFKQAVQMKGQARFHPLQFLKPLVEYITKNGGAIYEHSPAEDVEKGERPAVVLRSGVKAIGHDIVVASHFPFYDNGFYFAKLHPTRSYVIAIKPKKEFPGGMYITAEQPTRSVRSTVYNGEEVLLISGDGHKTGKGQPTESHYQNLMDFAEKEFGIEELLFTWSTQDLVPMDKIPYIGKADEAENIYSATGFKKWGMTTSVAAARLLSDLIVHKQNRYTELFSPDRFKADPGIQQFVKQQSDVAATFIKGKLDYFFKERGNLPIDQGIVVNWEGTRAGAFKEKDGTVHLVDTTCTHMGCECEWNDAERTWDCPCHGSRYSITGEVIEGPAKKPLKNLGEIGGQTWQE